MRMHIVVDTREQVPWTFEGQGVTTSRAKLPAGDYSVLGLEHRVAIERKSLDDFVGTVLRERNRFYIELEHLRSFDFRAVIVEASVREIASGNYKSSVKPNVLLGFIGEITVAQSVPVYLGGTRAECQVLATSFLSHARKRFGSSAGGAAKAQTVG